MPTNPRSLLNVTLLLLAAIAAAILYFKPQPSGQKPFTIVATLDSVQRIEIERTSGMQIVLAREREQWRMQAPVLGAISGR